VESRDPSNANCEGVAHALSTLTISIYCPRRSPPGARESGALVRAASGTHDRGRGVVGYRRLACGDEDRTLSRLRGLRSDLIDPAIAVHHGRVVKRTGGGSLIESRSRSPRCVARSRCRTACSSATPAYPRCAASCRRGRCNRSPRMKTAAGEQRQDRLGKPLGGEIKGMVR
jgi:hypothetical protein